jgi:DNA mismatch endonuclease (patch repair protein)
MDKINRNRKKDNENILALRQLGWRIFTVWECGLKPKRRERTLNTLLGLLAQ